MQAMLASPEAKLVVDDEQLLLSTYQAKCPGSYADYWLRTMLSRGAVEFVKRCTVDRGTRTSLREHGFVGEDLNRVVRTAAGGPSGLVVAHEPHFLARPVQRILRRRLSIRVLSAQEALELLTSSSTPT
jgi:hypothetical protein